jgi:NAD-dependent SIR2 family protein deacetylase
MEYDESHYDKLISKYEDLFEAPYIECQIGWYSLIEEAVEKLNMFKDHVKIAQIKEKFGTLRIYVSYPDDEDDKNITNEKEREKVYKFVDAIIAEAEYIAQKTCSSCSAKITRTQPRDTKRFIPICESCYQKIRKPKE